MKFATVLPALAAFASIASAKSLLAVFADKVTVGESYNVEWLSDAKEKLELELVHKTSGGWEQVQTLFKDKTTEQPGGNYTWTVGKSTPTGEGYGLWLSASSIKNPGTGYADLTSWFEIVPAEDKAKEDLKI
ncbi:hypothetical protein PRZ48_008218 [Zasmidium cellare]|uniref:Yeast cell wall synthesis Kre9/Knh1-like N-terminal domain-containing protein n=1 Tax=Zasmidium cellare TaxID=395010 RepID=A0ABR0EEY2_ZASCE|nr:hypothetical protein PRZ48_008218 [Zasmidium cellare]